jgi:alkylation response protein AidB-like acyl-CoA dehydrogenase
MSQTTVTPDELFAIDSLLSGEQKDIRDSVRGGLTEPDFGSNPAGMRTVAKRDGDDWVLNGTKMWITKHTLIIGQALTGHAAFV